MPYLGKQSEQVGVSVQKYEYLQGTDTTTGTTVFSIPSDSADHVNVYLNGVLLVEGGSDDYSKSNTAITFNAAPTDGDIVRCDVIESFALPDALKSSGDTMSGALKLNGGIKQQTSADLSGTYADHQVMLSDSYSVTGDVTITDNLVLAKLSDDSNAVSLTNDTSTRTVTGEGSLEMGTLIQTPNQSLTSMTGTVGSGVTINSDVLFPAGHIIQVAYNAENTTVYGGQSSPFVCYCFCDITIKSASSKILIQANPSFYLGNNNLIDARFLYKTSVGRSATLGDYTGISDTRNGVFGQNQTDDPRNVMANIFLQEQWVHGLSAGTIVNVAISAVRDEGPVGDIHNNRSWVAHEGNIASTMTLWEVAT